MIPTNNATRPKTAPTSAKPSSLLDKYALTYHDALFQQSIIDDSVDDDDDVEGDIELLASFLQDEITELVHQNNVIRNSGNEDIDELAVDQDDNSPELTDETISRCKHTARKILLSSRKRMINTIQAIHNKENERKNHMRCHYDNKLSTCRASYLLQQRHTSQVLVLKKLEAEGEMQYYFRSKLEQLETMLQQSQDIIRVQEKTVIECKQNKEHVEKELQDSSNKFEAFKSDMTTKYNQIHEDLNRKTKQEVWAHFKIMHLKKKIRKLEKILNIKKNQCRRLAGDNKDTKERLRISMNIRNGMEKSFERRASIRGRVDIINENIRQGSVKFERNNRNLCETRLPIDVQCQTDYQMVKVKHRGVDSSPFFANEIHALEAQLHDTRLTLERERGNFELNKRQNDAYKRLISGKSIALILASEHRKLSAAPKSLEAEMLYDLTTPQGIIMHPKPKIPGEQVVEESFPKKDDKGGNIHHSISIPTFNELVGFKGIKGKTL